MLKNYLRVLFIGGFALTCLAINNGHAGLDEDLEMFASVVGHHQPNCGPHTDCERYPLLTHFENFKKDRGSFAAWYHWGSSNSHNTPVEIMTFPCAACGDAVKGAREALCYSNYSGIRHLVDNIQALRTGRLPDNKWDSFLAKCITQLQ